jgi:hypothetical protein
MREAVIVIPFLSMQSKASKCFSSRSCMTALNNLTFLKLMRWKFYYELVIHSLLYEYGCSRSYKRAYSFSLEEYYSRWNQSSSRLCSFPISACWYPFMSTHWVEAPDCFSCLCMRTILDLNSTSHSNNVLSFISMNGRLFQMLQRRRSSTEAVPRCSRPFDVLNSKHHPTRDIKSTLAQNKCVCTG